jgi:hypothetical protein
MKIHKAIIVSVTAVDDFTVGKEYEAWDYDLITDKSDVYVIDDKGEKSALFVGEFEVIPNTHREVEE